MKFFLIWKKKIKNYLYLRNVLTFFFFNMKFRDKFKSSNRIFRLDLVKIVLSTPDPPTSFVNWRFGFVKTIMTWSFWWQHLSWNVIFAIKIIELWFWLTFSFLCVKQINIFFFTKIRFCWKRKCKILFIKCFWISSILEKKNSKHRNPLTVLF